jgi:hypothetical protein
MNATSRTDRKSGDVRVAGISRSPLLRLPIRLNFLGQEKHQELLLPAASDCAWSGAIAKDQRGRLDEERLAEFNQSADRSTYRRKKSVRTTRATALQPGVISAGRHLQYPAHHSNVEAFAVGLEKFVALTDLPRTRCDTHRHSSAPVTPLVSRVHKKLGSPRPWPPVVLEFARLSRLKFSSTI